MLQHHKIQINAQTLKSFSVQVKLSPPLLQAVLKILKNKCPTCVADGRTKFKRIISQLDRQTGVFILYLTTYSPDRRLRLKKGPRLSPSTQSIRHHCSGRFVRSSQACCFQGVRQSVRMVLSLAARIFEFQENSLHWFVTNCNKMNSIYFQVDTKTTKWINTNSLHVSNTTIITYNVGYSESQQWPLYSHSKLKQSTAFTLLVQILLLSKRMIV